MVDFSSRVLAALSQGTHRGTGNDTFRYTDPALLHGASLNLLPHQESQVISRDARHPTAYSQGCLLVHCKPGSVFSPHKTFRTMVPTLASAKDSHEILTAWRAGSGRHTPPWLV